MIILSGDVSQIKVDMESCRGCRRCEIVCSWNKSRSFGEKGVTNPRRSGVKVKSDEKNGFYHPLVCDQCDSKDCLEVCDTRAITVDNGAIVVDFDLCSGCGRCTDVCDKIWIDPKSGVAVKCDLCGDEEPICVDACKHDVLRCV
ncbi:Fe-S-cluster-containing hydrogenase component 2, HycB [Methanonatronarchaeum thermophilum]|uniref:Fe-S-cluster-containing hydrogenase component 2, HycB n=1 Tax=Methanonatronarchaeum thermophilum TaxID=1927129 RepID=A0A1Y3GCW7_9EURY|nr:Fe-S-cluster-containing hydrogenase component 2, HycB [Methanonatronarchaeum thermophilum]